MTKKIIIEFLVLIESNYQHKDSFQHSPKLATFLELGNNKLSNRTPRLFQAFKISLQKETTLDYQRSRNDRTTNRILAHLKTFAKWIDKNRPFPLGNPMAKIKLAATTSLFYY